MAVRQPCKTCPWRTGQDATEIPGFDVDLVERLERCAEDSIDAPQFGCHQSRPGEEFVCAGWLAVCGWDSLSVRLALARGEYDKEQLQPGDDWPELEGSLADVLDKLRATA